MAPAAVWPRLNGSLPHCHSHRAFADPLPQQHPAAPAPARAAPGLRHHHPDHRSGRLAPRAARPLAPPRRVDHHRPLSHSPRRAAGPLGPGRGPDAAATPQLRGAPQAPARCPASHPLARHRQHWRLAAARAGGPQARGLWSLGVAVVAAFWPCDSRLRVVPAVVREGSLGLGAVSGRWARSWFRRVALAAARARSTWFAAGIYVPSIVG
jgi:hypothetical protein